MRQVAQKGDPVLLELGGGPDARDEEELRAADHARGEDDLARGGDGERKRQPGLRGPRWRKADEPTRQPLPSNDAGSRTGVLMRGKSQPLYPC